MYPIDFFWRAAELYPDRIALDGPQGQVSYSTLSRQVAALAAAMQALDPTPQTRVAICAENSASHILALLATLASGKIWVPLNYRSTSPELSRIIDATEPSIIVVDAKGAPLISSSSGVRVALHDEGEHTLSELLARHAGKRPVAYDLPRDATQAIKFTGGTTGLPKGVMQPYRAWNANIINQIACWKLGPDDRYVTAAPITHGTGTYLLPVLAQGGTHLLLETSTPASVTHAFKERGGTLCFMPPTLIYMLMAQPGVTKADFPNLRHLIYGGAPMPTDKVDQARAFFGPVVATTYGQTEAPQLVTVLRPEDLDTPANRGSVGRLTWLSDMAVMGADGEILPRGAVGEVVVRGDLIMTGYWRLPEKTAETLFDGWLHTGDSGFIDDRGYLFLKDRLRDVIITGGFNVYPVDVENALSTHPAVYECSVFGVPDDKWGEAVHAAVQFHVGAQASDEELKAHVRALLGPVQTPKQFHVHASLPRSSVGKVLKTKVRELTLKEAQ